MKFAKISLAIIMTLFMVSCVFAQGKPDFVVTNIANAGEKIVNGEQIKERVRVQSEGLNGSVFIQRNERSLENLENTWERLQEKHRERINSLKELEIEDVDNETMRFRGEKRAKLFGLIELDKEITYIADEEGNVRRVSGIFDFLWRDLTFEEAVN